VIRLFNLYIPTRLLLLILGEIATVCASFSLAIFIRFRGESHIAFNDEHAFFKIFAVAVLALVCSHFTEFYDLRRCSHPRDVSARVLMMVAFFSFLFGALAYISPDLLVGRNSFLIGLCILAIAF